MKAREIELYAEKIRRYFLAFFAGSGSFLGLPLPGTLRIASKSSLVYKASCEKGLHPARCNRLFTVSRGIPSLSAISEIVIPFISPIIGIIHEILKNIPIKGYLLYARIVNNAKKIKNVPKKRYLLLTKCPFVGIIKT